MTKRLRPVLAVSLTAIAALLVFVALVLPDQSGRFKPGEFMAGAFLRIPLEGIVGAAVLLVLPARARRVAAVVLGLGLGVLALLKVINLGFRYVLARRFDPAGDALYVVDFGVMTTDKAGPKPRANTGVLWRIVRNDGAGGRQP